jgi:hypothetical protein
VRYTTTQKLYSIRAALDMWTPLTTTKDASIVGEERTQMKVDTYVRADVRTSQEVWAGLWLRYQDKDLQRGGHDQCFEISNEENEDGETIPCAGRQLTTIARARFVPDKSMSFTGMLEHQLLDDNTISKTKWRQDLGATVIGLYRPPRQRVRLRLRLRYLDESSELLGGDDMNLETSLSMSGDAAFQLREKDSLRVRLDSKFYFDDRTSTNDRDPNSDFAIWLQYEARL